MLSIHLSYSNDWSRILGSITSWRDVRDVKYVIKIQSRHHSITSSSVKYVQKYITFYVQTYVHSISNLINGANLSVKVQRAYKIFKNIDGSRIRISLLQNPVFDLEITDKK